MTITIADGRAALERDNAELRDRVIAYNAEIKAALQTMLGALNQGQRKNC